MTPPQQKPPLPRRTPRSGHAATARIQEAVAARDDLAAALSSVGLQLPVLDVRTPWPDTDGDDTARSARYALVHLGVCAAPVAHALAEVIRKGWSRVTDGALGVGTAVHDDDSGRVGLVMGHEGPYLQLRPLGGGREWDADPVRLRPLDAAELLSARVAEANARSRTGLGLAGIRGSPPTGPAQDVR